MVWDGFEVVCGWLLVVWGWFDDWFGVVRVGLAVVWDWFGCGLVHVGLMGIGLALVCGLFGCCLGLVRCGVEVKGWFGGWSGVGLGLVWCWFGFGLEFIGGWFGVVFVCHWETLV